MHPYHMPLRLWIVGLCVCLGGIQAPARAAESADPPAVDIERLRQQTSPAVAKALEYLSSQQAADGGWRGPFPGSDPSITSLAAMAFLQSPAHGKEHVVVRRAVECVLRFRQPDGGIYNAKVGYGNYATSIALAFLAKLRDPSHKETIQSARRYLLKEQWGENRLDDKGQPINENHPYYGGAGYGKSRRPDLSNTQWMVEALHASGLSPEDPAYAKALRFISRCQMLGSTNDQPFAQGSEDGGFIYTAAQGGSSQAGEVTINDRRQPRSYGSMTYAGFKSMIYANLDRRDARVQAAWKWIRAHYSLEANPNMPEAQSEQGLYYFYHTFAKALAAWGEPLLIDAKGTPHDWRSELCDTLIRKQRGDGSWSNPADRWYEDDPVLVTSYAVLAIQAALAAPTGEVAPASAAP